jgi:hypothetical protein
MLFYGIFLNIVRHKHAVTYLKQYVVLENEMTLKNGSAIAQAVGRRALTRFRS